MPTIDDDVMKNLIYCEDTHSFVHRLFDKWKKKFPEGKNEAQNDAWDVVGEINKEMVKDEP